MRIATVAAGLLMLVLIHSAVAGSAGTAFSYQGQLTNNGQPYSGTASLSFELYDADSGGTPLAGPVGPVAGNPVAVSQGLFQVALDFGQQSWGAGLWLQVIVDGTPVVPRQLIPAVPHALGVAAGSVGIAEIDAGEVQRRIAGSCPTGSAIDTINSDGTVSCELIPEIPTDYWALGGNAGTSSGVDFLGTIDNQPFEIRTNGSRHFRIEPSSEIFEGEPNTANLIGGSSANAVDAGVLGATISGGGLPLGDSDPNYLSEAPNRVFDDFGAIGGGYGNTAGSDDANTDSDNFAVVSGGRSNQASASFSTVAGGNGNEASGTSSAVGGGENGVASGTNATIAGGLGNEASGGWSAALGGAGNQALGTYATVGGGFLNEASGGESTVAGGNGNAATAYASTVAGGLNNSASGNYANVGGGRVNSAVGRYSVSVGGSGNCAGGEYSFASGRNAKVRPQSDPGSGSCAGLSGYSGDSNGDEGTFVWADSQSAAFVSSGPDQFLIRSSGGVGINTNSPNGELHILGGSPTTSFDGQLEIQGSEETGAADTGAGITLTGHDGSIARVWATIRGLKENASVGDRRSYLTFQTRNGSGNMVERFRIDSDGGTYNTSGGWLTFSDERLKTNIEPIESPLERLLSLSGRRFEYRPEAPLSLGDAGVRMGFIAQQVEQVFPEWVRESREGYKAVATIGFQALMVESLRELKQRQEGTLAELASENVELRRELIELRSATDDRLAVLEEENERLAQMLADRQRRSEARIAALEALLVEENPALAQRP